MNRRSLLKRGAVLGGIAASPAAIQALTPPSLSIYDSRSLPGRAFALLAGGRKIDLAEEHGTMLRGLRSLAPKCQVEGLTSWSDYVVVRGLLEERGLRVRHEARHGRLFRWTMA